MLEPTHDRGVRGELFFGHGRFMRLAWGLWTATLVMADIAILIGGTLPGVLAATAVWCAVSAFVACVTTQVEADELIDLQRRVRKLEKDNA